MFARHAVDPELASEPLSGGRTLVVWQMAMAFSPTRGTTHLATLSAAGRRLQSVSYPGLGASFLSGGGIVRLDDGGALTCWTRQSDSGFSGARVAVVSPTGAVSVSVGGSANANPPSAEDVLFSSCAVAATGSDAVVLWDYSDTPQPTWYLQRLLGTGQLTPPILVSPDVTVGDAPPSIAVTSTGAVAISWIEELGPISDGVSKAEMRWITPGDTVGPVIGLQRARTGNRSARLYAIGPTSVIALVGDYSALLAEEVDTTGLITDRSHIGHASASGVQSAASDSGIVAAWQDQSGSLYAAKWTNGQWQPASTIGTCVSTTPACAQLAGVAINARGEAAILTDVTPDLGNGHFGGSRIEATFDP
jgi:hypothetical protein